MIYFKYKLQVVPSKVIPLESNALSHPSLPCLHALLEGFFRDPLQLRHHKVTLIAFFDVRGFVHCEFLPQGQTINQHVYKEILRRLLRSVREKRQELWEDNSWVLHHDNAPAHTAPSIREFLAQKNIAVLEQPPYSPDPAPCDFFLFPKLKGVIKGICFEDVHDIKKAMTTELRIPEETFQECIQAWQRRMGKCIRLQGDYFEGDNL